MKVFLTNFFLLFVCVFLHAEPGAVFDKSVKIGDCVYIADSTLIYGNKHIIVKKNTSPKTEEPVKTEEEKPAPPAKNETSQTEPMQMLFPTLPFDHSSSSFLQSGVELAAISHHGRKKGSDEQVAKAVRANKPSFIENLYLSLYYPEQRQKLSIAAIQCGELTAFGSQSPPA